MQKGFTLIELMVTLVVLVIALSIGVPSFVTWIENNRLDTATRTLASALQVARNEAVSRQSVITVDSGGNWGNGLTIYTDTTPTGNTAQTAGDVLIKDLDFSMDGITTTTNDNRYISFTNTGLLSTADVSPLILTLCHTSGEPDGTQITINTVGRTSISDKNDCP
jgi:prepilin-type N-terminal cleavage/methylation domain-containing protein